MWVFRLTPGPTVTAWVYRSGQGARPACVTIVAVNDVGLIGCGNWGKNILRDLLSLDSAVYVADVDATARDRAQQSGAAGVCSTLEALPDCDGYVVAVPIPSLTPVTLAILERQKPVFVEKTLCLTMDDCAELSQHPQAANVFAMHKWHYHPGIEALRQVAASGELGSLQQMQTTRHAWVSDFHGGDVFWTQAVHDLTIVKHVLGHIPEDIHLADVVLDDSGLPVQLFAVMGADPTVLISVSGHHTSKVSAVSVHGSRGTAELRDSLDDAIVVRTVEGARSVPIDTEYPLVRELKEFMGYLQGGARPRCGLAAAQEVTHTLLRLRQAAGLV